MKKMIIIIMTILLLSVMIISAQETTTQTPTQLTEIELKKLIIEQNAKTTAEIKTYLDKKSIEYDKNTQKYVDENFKILDERIDSFIRKASFKLGAVFLSALIAGELIVLLIKRKIEKTVILKKQFYDDRHKEQVKINLPTNNHHEEIRAPQKPQQKIIIDIDKQITRPSGEKL